MEKEYMLDGLKFIAETHRGLHDKRQRYEWRILFTILSFYILSVSAKYRTEIVLPKNSQIHLWIWVVFIIVAIITITYLFFIHKANARNKTIAEKTEDSILDFIKGTETNITYFSMDDFRMTYWAVTWQAAMILTASITSSYLITN